ncbi:MAG TPA: PKD domain-containing protein, partial [Nocardioidaceae bacterium]|nr:PKD domain-containing protein [Nocardioidaceae bacterium]
MARIDRILLILSALALVNCGKGAGSSMNQGGVPPGWSSKDIGAVGSAGAFTYSGGQYSAAGSGSDIWDTADAFRYVYRTLNGDGEMTARVLSLDNTDGWAKAGVMIRESLAADSRFAMTVVTPSNGSSFQVRPVAGQGCSLVWGPAHGAPYWVRIRRTGDTLAGFASDDGSNWTTIGSQTISMAASVTIGLCVTAHNNSKIAGAGFDHVDWTGGGGAVFDPSKLGPDVYPITVAVVDGDMHGTFATTYVQVTNPVGGNQAPSVTQVTATPSTVAPMGTVQLSATATDADGDPLRFTWVVPAGENTCSPKSTETWRAPSQPGTYTIRVLVGDGKVLVQGSVMVTVTGSNPTSGTGNHPSAIQSLSVSSVSVAPGETVTLAVDAIDVDGPALNYGWGAPGGGSLTGSGTSVTWTAPAIGTGRPAKAGLWTWNRSLPSGCPVPLSTDLPGIAFQGRASTAHF